MFEAKSVGLDGEERLSNAPSFHGTSVVRQEMAGVLERNRVQGRFRTSMCQGEFRHGRGQPLLVRGSVWLVGNRRVEDSEREAEVQGRKIEPLGFREVRSSGSFVLERSSWRENARYRSRGRVRRWSCKSKRSSYRDEPNFEERGNPEGGAQLRGISAEVDTV